VARRERQTRNQNRDGALGRSGGRANGGLCCQSRNGRPTTNGATRAARELIICGPRGRAEGGWDRGNHSQVPSPKVRQPDHHAQGPRDPFSRRRGLGNRCRVWMGGGCPLLSPPLLATLSYPPLRGPKGPSAPFSRLPPPDCRPCPSGEGGAAPANLVSLGHLKAGWRSSSGMD